MRSDLAAKGRGVSGFYRLDPGNNGRCGLKACNLTGEIAYINLESKHNQPGGE
jgi:hypothetical protein